MFECVFAKAWDVNLLLSSGTALCVIIIMFFLLLKLFDTATFPHGQACITIMDFHSWMNICKFHPITDLKNGWQNAAPLSCMSIVGRLCLNCHYDVTLMTSPFCSVMARAWESRHFNQQNWPVARQCQGHSNIYRTLKVYIWSFLLENERIKRGKSRIAVVEDTIEQVVSILLIHRKIERINSIWDRQVIFKSGRE